MAEAAPAQDLDNAISIMVPSAPIFYLLSGHQAHTFGITDGRRQLGARTAVSASTSSWLIRYLPGPP